MKHRLLDDRSIAWIRDSFRRNNGDVSVVARETGRDRRTVIRYTTGRDAAIKTKLEEFEDHVAGLRERVRAKRAASS